MRLTKSLIVFCFVLLSESFAFAHLLDPNGLSTKDSLVYNGTVELGLLYNAHFPIEAAKQAGVYVEVGIYNDRLFIRETNIALPSLTDKQKLAQDIAALRKDAEDLTGKVAELTRQKKELTQSCATAQKELQTFRSQHESLQESLRQLETQKLAVQEEISGLKSQSAQLRLEEEKRAEREASPAFINRYSPAKFKIESRYFGRPKIMTIDKLDVTFILASGVISSAMRAFIEKSRDSDTAIWVKLPFNSPSEIKIKNSHDLSYYFSNGPRSSIITGLEESDSEEILEEERPSAPPEDIIEELPPPTQKPVTKGIPL